MRPFKPEHYFRAALERMRQAEALYFQGQCYALAMYVAGLATECLLRAFKGRRDPTFDERHDLLRLFQASGLLTLTADDLKHSPQNGLAQVVNELRAAVNDIHVLWSNDYRFASEDRLKSELKKYPLFRAGLKGDILKGNAHRLLNAAKMLLERGSELWQLF